MTTPTVVGIDLGTTFSLAAFVENGRPVVVRDAHGLIAGLEVVPSAPPPAPVSVPEEA